MPDRAQILQELDRRGALPEQYRAEYEQVKASGSIAPKGGFKPIPDAAATKLEEQVSAFAGLDRAVTSFKDDFSGPGSDVENFAQGIAGVGTSGQRDWWSDFRSSDNQVRNALFGASLTPGEQASYAATSITPSMTAKEIKANLTRRRDLAREMLGRRAAYACSNGYMPEAVSAILGDYDPAKQLGAQVRPLSIDSATDYALGLGGAPRGKPEQRPDGTVAVKMPDGTETTYPSQAAFNQSLIEDQLAGVFGGDRNSEGYRAAFKARFGENAPLEAQAAPGQPPKPIDAGDGMTGALARGIGDAVTFGGLDELGGVADTIAGDGGSGSFTDRLGRNITRNRSILAGDEENHPYARFGGQMVGGLAIPFGAGARTAGELARVGAVGGGLYGFGSAVGNVLDRTPDALAGTAVGALGGYAFGKAAPVVGNALARVLPQPGAGRAQANALGQAAQRQGVPMTAADIRPGARNALAYLEASPGGSGPVQNALAAGNDALEGAVGRVGGGAVQTREDIGGMVQNAGRRFIGWSRDRKNDMYTQAERLAGGATIPSQSAVTTIDQNIAELQQTPNANRALLGLLTDLREDLTLPDGSPRALSISAIRNLRTAMRGEIGSRNLTMTDAERRVSQVIDAASGDINAGLNRVNPRAAAAYQRADQFYAERQRYIRDVVQHYTGARDQPLSGEKAYERIMALTGDKGDRQKLLRVMQGLSNDEQADVASTVAANLGRRAPDDDFSPARFVTQAEKMTAGAREAVFGRDGAAAIEDLIQIAAAKRDTGNSLNRSRSGQVGNYDRWLTGGISMLGAGGGYAAGGAGGAAVGAVVAGVAKAGALNLSARLLTNPQFVRWLGRAPANASPAQITAHVRQLSNLAIREQPIRSEIQQLQPLLSDTTTTRAIASEGERSDDQQANRYKTAAAGR